MRNFFVSQEIYILSLYLAVMSILPGIAYIAVGNLLFLILIKGKEWYLKSIMYMVLLKFLNPIFTDINTNIFYIFIFILFIILVIKIVKQKDIYINKFELYFYTLLLIFTLTSIIGSLYLDLSLIKLSMYSIVVFTVFQAIKYGENYDFIKFLIILIYLFVWVSFILIFIPYGYFINGLFMGVFQHSQTIGVILVPLLTLLIVLYFSNKLQHNLINILTIFLGLFELYLSGSRTAIFSILLPLLIYFSIYHFFRFTYSKKNIIIILIILFTSITVYSLNSSKINNGIKSFIIKSATEKTVQYNGFGNLLSKRLILIETAKENFLNNFWTGIGFNVQTVYADPRDASLNKIKYIPGTDIIYNKPLEKGNLYYSVFEEGGVLTGVFFIYILFYLLYSLFKSNITYAWVMLLSMFISFNGEAALFSSGGLGIYQLIVMIILFASIKNKVILEKGR